MRASSFEAVILEGHKQAAVEVPFDPREKWGIEPTRIRAGRNGYRVQATLNGVAFEGSIVPRMRRFWLEIPDELEVGVGETVRVVVKPMTQ